MTLYSDDAYIFEICTTYWFEHTNDIDMLQEIIILEPKLAPNDNICNIVNWLYLFTHIDHVLLTQTMHTPLKSARFTGSNSTKDIDMLDKLIILEPKSPRSQKNKSTEIV